MMANRGKSDFAALIDLTNASGDVFRAPPAPERSGRMYGGQLLAQGLAAAMSTIDPGRDVHSLHAYFLRPGDVDEPVQIDVERIRDGRSFSTRMTRAAQHGKELFRMMASFHVPELGDDYARAEIPDAPAPDTVSLTYNEFSRQNGEASDWDGEARPMDIRYINPPTMPPGEPVLEAQRMWVRISTALADEWPAHYAGLAYLSDSTLIDHVVLPAGRRWQDPELTGASLDHSMWFHHRARADEWLLFDQHVEVTGHGRGFASGRFFDRGGRLVASCTQEGLIRWS